MSGSFFVGDDLAQVVDAISGEGDDAVDPILSNSGELKRPLPRMAQSGSPLMNHPYYVPLPVGDAEQQSFEQLGTNGLEQFG